MTDHVVTAGRSDHVRELLSGYLNDDLEDADRQAVEEHLESCEPCRGDLTTLRMTVTALGQLPSAPRPRDFSLAPEPVRRQSSIAWVRLTGGALAAVLAVVIGSRLLFPSTHLLQTSSPAAPAARPIAPFSAAAPTGAPAAANVPAPAPPGPAAAAPGPPARNEPKAAGSSGAAPGASAGVVSTSRVMAVATRPAAAPYPPPASAPVAPGSNGAHPSAQSAVSPTPQSDSYPMPEIAPNPNPSETGYPSPGPFNGTGTIAPDATNYPAPATAVAPQTSSASSNASDSVNAPSPLRETTWFTPALGILGGLVLATALVLWAIGRRSP